MAYIIKSQLSGYVLDAEGGGNTAGAKVIPWDRHGGANQQWYDDVATGTIRLKANQFCMTVQDNQLCVKPYQQGDQNQQLFRQDKSIRSRQDNNKALDIFQNNKEKGAKIGLWAFNGGPNQSWDFEIISKKEFAIVSDMNQKVLDVENGNAAIGTRVLMWSKNNPAAKNQLWYLDPQGYIRSSLNDLPFSNGGSTQGIRIAAASGNDQRSHFYVDGKKILNKVGEVLDISRQNGNNGAEVITYAYKGQNNQHWHFDYV